MSLGRLRQRVVAPEGMDDPHAPADELARSLRFLRVLNRTLGGVAGVLQPLRRWSKRWPPGQTIRILDLATGGGDIPLAIVRWARSAGHDVQVTALDRHPTTLALARQSAGDLAGDIRWVQADALKPPFAPGSFDYVLANLFLHHLPDIEVLTALRIMDRLATRGMIWNDLWRNRWAWTWARLLTLPAAEMVRQDAVRSVEAGFSRAQVLDLRRRLGLEHLALTSRWGYRFTLAGERR